MEQVKQSPSASYMVTYPRVKPEHVTVSEAVRGRASVGNGAASTLDFPPGSLQPSFAGLPPSLSAHLRLHPNLPEPLAGSLLEAPAASKASGVRGWFLADGVPTQSLERAGTSSPVGQPARSRAGVMGSCLL